MSNSFDEIEASNVVHAQFGRPKQKFSNSKAFFFDSQLIKDGYAKIALDARMAAVLVPHEFLQDPQLTLEFTADYFLGKFSFDDEGISAFMAFASGRFHAYIPWSAVFAIAGRDEALAQYWPIQAPQTQSKPAQHLYVVKE